MEHAKAMHERTRDPMLVEPKNADTEEPTTVRHIEGLEVPVAHLHSKTFLVVAVSKQSYNTGLWLETDMIPRLSHSFNLPHSFNWSRLEQ
jgi:hypothetical protein